MKTPRDIYGRDLANHLVRLWQYVEDRQLGSHIILRTDEPTGQTLPIPAHKPLKTGTLSAIVRMVADHKQVSRKDILQGF
ncbi:type II toxin-antitoxin system HicA family toxin [Granulicella paludicola]|uniref:type II toxin-antitoxin system HicA family toxin n=1 Tax=Granulicella paludicola TaxID=474951 RepID=UPI00295B9345|nr:type II toxin-antitoxin system HicA family toxin [Granulicella paludicola]